MRVLVVNAGSSSVKLRVLGADDDVEAALATSNGGTEPTKTSVAAFLAGRARDRRGRPSGRARRSRVSRRRCGSPPTSSARCSRSRRSRRCTNRAPSKACARCGRLRPDLPQVACFDTAFHATMPAAATTYALPEAVARAVGHAPLRLPRPVARVRVARASPSSSIARDDDALRVVCCHLGAGASLCATRGGRSVDTTMGWTPLEGLVMATRSGIGRSRCRARARARISASTRWSGRSTAKPGLAGLSGIPGGDLRAVLAARAAGDAAATLAFDVYVHRLAAGDRRR